MKSKKAFSLVELMVVTVIAGIVCTTIIVPQVSMWRMRMRLDEQAVMLAEMNMARDFITGEIRKQRSGANYLRADADVKDPVIISLGISNQCDNFELDAGNLIFDGHTNDPVTILSDVVELNADIVGSPVLHIRYDIKMERKNVIMHREFVAVARNESE